MSFFLLILRHSVLLKTGILLNSDNFVTEMKGLLCKIKIASDSVLIFFIGNVFPKVSGWQLLYCLRKIRGHSSNDEAKVQEYSEDSMHPQSFTQLVYHIGGAVLNGVLSKSKRYCNNPDWILYGDIVTQKFLCVEVNSEPQCVPAHMSCFTAGKDRGALKYRNREAFDFFHTLF